MFLSTSSEDISLRSREKTPENLNYHESVLLQMIDEILSGKSEEATLGRLGGILIQAFHSKTPLAEVQKFRKFLVSSVVEKERGERLRIQMNPSFLRISNHLEGLLIGELPKRDRGELTRAVLKKFGLTFQAQGI